MMILVRRHWVLSQKVRHGSGRVGRMRYRDVPLNEMVALEHSLRVHRHALMAHNRLLTDVMRSKNHKAVKQLARVERELILLAGEVEGQAIRVHGPDVFNPLERAHLADCVKWKAHPPWPVPVCDIQPEA